jgi:uncharacterized protein (TIGR00251 family)
MMEFSRHIVGGKLKIEVKANANKTGITGFDKEKNALKVNVKAQPQKGKANAEIIRLFSKLTKKKVEIISGAASKTKILRFC